MTDSLLQAVYDSCDCQPPSHVLAIDSFVDELSLLEHTPAERLEAGLRVLFDVLELYSQPQQVDACVIDDMLLKIDLKISQYVNSLKAHPDIQQLESLWRSLDFLCSGAGTAQTVQLELLCATQDELAEDFRQAMQVQETGLFHHIYESEYDMPGGEPFAAIVTPFEFTAQTQDVKLLEQISILCSRTHCPFIANINHNFFQKSSMQELLYIRDFDRHFQKSDYIAWRELRKKETTRFLGLCFPRFVLPASEPSSLAFNYHPNEEETPLWGHASFAFAINLCQSFHQYGWCVNIRGPESGGKVSGLPLTKLRDNAGICYQHPIEFLLSETIELQLANHGIIPLTYYKNSNYACFFSANSVHRAIQSDKPEVTANQRINARLPYIFLISRIAHYLKVIQRERIGSQKTAAELAHELNTWLKTLITKMSHPSAELQSYHPLSDGYVEVQAAPDNPGVFQVALYAKPHFQVEGVDVTLNLTAHLPGKDKE